ncbi:MAG: ribosome assembly cofactor RimP [Bacteroidales bacterium]|nr:ribosome assembly cofactor RimP [Bacteroidales bacterium]
MIDKLKVLDIIQQTLEGSDKFLVDLKITTDNRINVSIDSDSAVVIDDCVELSRAIESSLNRDEEDFELNVASAGLDSPLKMPRQYIKNIGQELAVTSFDGDTTEGKLTEASDDHIIITTPKTKKEPSQQISFKYSDIKTAKIIIKF